MAGSQGLSSPKYYGPSIKPDLLGINDVLQECQWVLVPTIAGAPSEDPGEVVTCHRRRLSECCERGVMAERIPVPRGTMAQGGLEHWESCPTLSRHCRTQLGIRRVSVSGKILSPASSLSFLVVKSEEVRIKYNQYMLEGKSLLILGR